MSGDNTASHCFAFCSLFESEVLLQLLLEKWNHPLAENEGFREAVLESTALLLETASDEHCSEVFIEGLPANQMNFVASVWYVEFCSVQDPVEFQPARQQWLKDVRHSLPSCFCSTEMLEP